MPHSTTLDGHVSACFEAAFGPPLRAHDSTLTWMVRPAPGRAPISVILNQVSDEECLVWMFDPNQRINGIDQRTLSNKCDVD